MPYHLHHFRGAPYNAGFAVGRAVGSRIGESNLRLIETWPSRDGVIDHEKLREGVLSWLQQLPQRYRLELQGLADGAGLPVETIASGYFAEDCCCSSFMTSLSDGHIWVGRNNDAWAPELWHGVTVHEITDRLPRIGFGFEAETFTTTGINSQRLWLHCNAGPARDKPSGTRPCFYPHIIVSEALETCASLADVESLLDRWERTRGMILFVADGKTDEAAMFECECATHDRRPAPHGPHIAANHSDRPELHEYDRRRNLEHGLQRSRARCAAMERLLAALRPDSAAGDLQRVLADENVEQRFADRLTVFSTVACPATGELWYACGEGPAASTGTWSRVAWPWSRLPGVPTAHTAAPSVLRRFEPVSHDFPEKGHCDDHPP